MSLPRKESFIPCSNKVIAKLVGNFIWGFWETLRVLLRFLFSKMEDLTKHWKSLSLSDREGPGLCLKKEQATSEHAITARFLTKRPLNIDAIANTFTPLWRTKLGFKVKHIEDHVVLFSFDNKADVDRIIAAETWSFDKHLLVLTRYDKEAALHASDLTKVAFWVQVFNI